MLGGINPWISMWSEPRRTIRSIVNTNPKFGVFYLAIIYAVQAFFFLFSHLHLTTSVHLNILLGVIFSPLVGIFWLCSCGFIFYWIGRGFRGTAPVSHLIAAVAWSNIPMSISLLMWFVLLVASQGVDLLYYPKGISSVFILFIAFIVSAWSFVLLIQSIREVQHFSLGKAILNVSIFYSCLGFVVFYFI